MVLNPILIDTNAYSSFKRNHSEALRIIQTAEDLVISTVVLGELYYGFLLGNQAANNATQLENFLASWRVRVVPVTDSTAHRYAGINKQLRLSGRPIPTNDIWIGAHALEHGCNLFSYDNHFRQISGLCVGATLAELL